MDGVQMEPKSPDFQAIDFHWLLSETEVAFAKCETLDDICMQAVLLSLNVLCLDRVAILLISEDGTKAQGTWGTDEKGELNDEHDFEINLASDPDMRASLDQKGALVVKEDIPITYYTSKVGTGWTATASIWHGENPIGWFTCDNLLSARPINSQLKDVIAVFSTIFGQWFIRKKTELELYTLNDTLELQVYEKTRELQDTIDNLTSMRSELDVTEKANALSHFTAGVAHEINNPISFIKSNLSYIGKVSSKVLESIEILGLESLKKPSEMLHEVDTVIEESVEGLDRVSDIVSLLQPLNKLADEEPQVFDVKSSIEFYTMSLEEGAEYIDIVGPDVPFSVSLPLQVFTLALDNIVQNALYAVKDQSNSKISIRFFKDDKYFGVSVLDNGVGISEDNLPNIFNPFFTTKPVGEGVGLGLALSENLLKMVNGGVRVESILGEKSEFSMIFPKEVVVER
jgi:signal transduction histidine kinase